MWIFTLLLIWFALRFVKADFKRDYDRVKNAHKAMELWEDDDEEREECKEVSKKNG